MDVMDIEDFEKITQQAFDHLPPLFKNKIENVEIVIENFPEKSASKSVGGNPALLLGLYQGIPLPHRGTWYGMTPTMPDRISIYKENIERLCTTEEEIRIKIYEVLCHEIGHYFGMNEKEIRSAMSTWESN